MAFMLGKHLVFLDSFQFMASCLERLAENLPADKFNYTSQAFKREKLALTKKKGARLPIQLHGQFSEIWGSTATLKRGIL